MFKQICYDAMCDMILVHIQQHTQPPAGSGPSTNVTTKPGLPACQDLAPALLVVFSSIAALKGLHRNLQCTCSAASSLTWATVHAAAESCTKAHSSMRMKGFDRPYPPWCHLVALTLLWELIITTYLPVCDPFLGILSLQLLKDAAEFLEWQ